MLAAVLLLLPVPAAAQLPRARSATVAVEDARPFARARWLLRNRAYDAALRDLAAFARTTRILADRTALLTAQALEGKGDRAGARRAYLAALEASAAPAVTQAALRGLAGLAARAGDALEALAQLDRLLDLVDPPEPALALDRAAALLALDRRAEAEAQLWALLDAYPDPQVAERAEKLLRRVTRRALQRDERARRARARAAYWSRGQRWGRARAALLEARRDSPGREAELDLLIARVDRQRGGAARGAAEARLQSLALGEGLDDELRAEVLCELGRVAMDRYQYERARYIFQEVMVDFPETAGAARAAYEAAQAEYDAGHYGRAARMMLAIEGKEVGADLAQEALWMAGWSAYLSGASAEAVGNLERLLASDPGEPEVADRATYWLGRAHEKAEHWQAAIYAYREVAARSPLRYYGLWARAHLETLHSPWRLEPLDALAPASIEEALALLAADRTINVERAVALFRAGLVPEEVEELLAAMEHYRGRRHRLGMTVVVDLFHLMGRDKWAELIARDLADQSPEQPGLEPYFWRVWRRAYPTPYGPEVERASRDHYVDPFLTYAVMRTESRFRPDVVSAVGARGLMQLMPATARWIGRTDPEARREAARYRAPAANIWLGSWYLRSLADRYARNAVQMLGAYNAGPGAMDQWIARFGHLSLDEFAERVPYDETRRYIRRTLESFMIYHALYDRPAAAARQEPEPAER